MSSSPHDPQSARTRPRLLMLLRHGERTADELATALGITASAVRMHLAALEGVGQVRRAGLRPTARRPAALYALTAAAEARQSRAYAPVLSALVGVLEERLPGTALRDALASAGERLGTPLASPPDTPLAGRAAAAAAVLGELGGVVGAGPVEEGYLLHGESCPLADAVRRHPATCAAATALVSAVAGLPAEERCEHGEHPRCRFLLRGA